MSIVSTKRIQGPVWDILARSEDGKTVYASVIAVKPETALAMFRGEWPGHEVKSMHKSASDWVVLSA